MTYEKLKKVGTKVHEDDFYDNGLYLFTVSYWVYNGTLYRHEEHPNDLKYTGKTTTSRCSDGEADYYISRFPEEDAKKCTELIGGYIKKWESESIKDHRKAAGLTQEEFSELFDPPIPIDTIKKWDSGKMQPPDWVKGLIIEKLEGMKVITEKALLDNYSGISNGLSYISIVNGKTINWDYRRGKNGDGYNPAREKREDAEEIYIYYSGEMIPLENGCDVHPSLEKMYEDYEKAIYG